MARFKRQIGVYHEKDREANARALEEFLARGRKIQKIPDSREVEKIRRFRARKEATGKVNIFSEQEIYNDSSD